MIVREFLNGDSLKGIKEKLEKASIPSPARESKWTTQTILRILQNEKYAGDVLLQKTYTSDFLEGKVKKNNGELPQYYIKDNHPAILKLKQQKKRLEYTAERSEVMESKAQEVMGLISAEDLDLTEYSDALVYRIIERITVLSKEEIRIRFVGGFEITQSLH